MLHIRKTRIIVLLLCPVCVTVPAHGTLMKKIWLTRVQKPFKWWNSPSTCFIL